MDGIKSQDLGLLLKLVSLQKQERLGKGYKAQQAWPHDWQDWDDEGEFLVTWMEEFFGDESSHPGGYTVRSLEAETGIGKSQVSSSLRRCFDVGFAKRDRKSGVPRVNSKSLFEFIVYGARYVFPAKPGPLVRGIRTAFSAPVLESHLFSAGELLPVWPDARGNNKGLEISPLFKTVGYAVRRDPELYALLALVDAIRIGSPRESNLAKELLKNHMEVTE